MLFSRNYGKKIRKKILSLQQDKSAKSLKEQFVLKISMYFALILAIFGVLFGVFANSSAIIFDGFVCLVSVALGFLSVLTSRFIYKEDDDVFQYGYVRFEPLVNLFKSLVLLIVCIYAFISGISSIIQGGYTLDLGKSVIYTICAFMVCFIIYIYIRFYSKILDSELIGVDKAEWLIDCVLYMGGILAFGAVYIMDPLQELALSKFIDPALLVILSLILSFTPMRICISNLKDLIMIAPPLLDEKITQVMEALSNEYEFEDYDTHVAKSGRFFMIEVNILSSNASKKISGGELDKIRDKILSQLEIPSYRIWLLVSLTADKKWL
ncbi:cation transporter [Campylobacter sp. LR264d]|nr:cation transporter [Campylobacter sp. LR286c]KAA6227868.1 cation transporter [Campylobacter sp. LR185c]KAA6228276.1 cation transporter [Campylobacter sp. LR196d]KAA6231082.1 cation transporter [Campylobacter sp. LR264d]KAA8604444.1 cation transporter [Campylobacter sp. LR185c]